MPSHFCNCSTSNIEDKQVAQKLQPCTYISIWKHFFIDRTFCFETVVHYNMRKIVGISRKDAKKITWGLHHDIMSTLSLIDKRNNWTCTDKTINALSKYRIFYKEICAPSHKIPKGIRKFKTRYKRTYSMSMVIFHQKTRVWANRKKRNENSGNAFLIVSIFMTWEFSVFDFPRGHEL